MKQLFFLFLILYSHLAGAQKLLEAVKENNQTQAKKLIRQGENINQRDSNGATVLMWAVLKTDLNFCKYLIKKGADSKLKGVIYTDSTRSQYYGNILGICAMNDHYDWLEWFVKHEKIDVNDREYNLADGKDNGWVALQYAVYKNHQAGFDQLVKMGADIYYFSVTDSANILLDAINYGYTALAKKVIEFKNLNLNHKNINGFNALHYSVYLNNVEIAELLLQKGLSPNAQSDSLITPLHASVSNYFPYLTKLLMTHNADTGLRNIWGETPGMIARHNGNKGIQAILKKDYRMLNLPLYDSLYNLYSMYHGKNETDSIAKYASLSYQQASLEFYENTGKYEQSINIAGVGLYNAGQFREAKQLFIHSLSTLKKYRPADTADRCQYLKNIISASLEMDLSYDSVRHYFEELINLNKAFYGGSSDKYIESRRLKILFISKTSNPELAITEYKLLLKYCDSIGKNQSVSYFNMLNSVAVLYGESHQVMASISSYEMIIDAYKKRILPKGFDFKHTVKNICIYLANEGRYDLVKPYLSLYRTVIFDQKPLSYEHLYLYSYTKGVYYHETQSYDSAIDCFKNAIVLGKNYTKINDNELAVCYIQTVNSLVLLERMEQADLYLDTALYIFNQMKNMLPGFYNEINATQISYYNFTEYKKSIKLNEILIRIAQVNADTSRILNSKKSMFYAFYRDGQVDRARLLLKEILQIEDKYFKKQPGNRIPFFNNLGYFYSELKDTLMAIHYYKEAIYSAQGLTNADSLQLASEYRINELRKNDGLKNKAELWLQKEVFRIKLKKQYTELEKTILEDYIQLLGETGKNEDALRHCQFWAEVYMETSPFISSNWLIKKGDIFNRKKEYATAEIYYLAAENFLLKKYNENSKEMILVHAKLGNNFYLSKKYDQAVPYMKKVIEVEEKNGASKTDLKSYYNSLKIIYYGINDMSMAEYYSDKLIEINGGDLKIDFQAFLKSRTDHIFIKQSVGKYDEAEFVGNELLVQMYKNKSYSQRDRLKVYGQLGYFYSEIGNSNMAILCIDSSASIIQKHFKSDLEKVHNSIIQKALIYATNDKSKEGLEQLRSHYHSMKDSEPDTSESLNETMTYMGLAYMYRKEFDSALMVLKAVQNHYLMGNYYSSILISALKYSATIYNFKKDNDSALFMFKLAKNLALKEKGKLENYWDLSLQIAKIYAEKLQLDSCLLALNEILQNQNQIGLTDKEIFEETTLSKAYVLSYKGQFEEAYPLFMGYLNTKKEQILDKIMFLSASERENFLSKKSNALRTVNTKLIRYLDNAPQYGNLILDNELFIKGLALETNTRLIQMASNSNDPELMMLMDKIKIGKVKLENLYNQDTANKTETSELESNISKWEKALNKKTGMNFKEDFQRNYTLEIKNKLKPDEILVDFFSRDVISDADNDSIPYYAIVVTRDFKYPKILKITDNKALDKLFSNTENLSSAVQLSRIYETRGSVLVNKTQINYSNCYDLIWQKIDSLTGGKKNIYITPTGYLNKISFAAIKDRQQVYISDKYNIHILSSSRQLLNVEKTSTQKNKTGFVLGGINYDLDSIPSNGSKKLATRSYTFDADSVRKTGFSYLEGTYSETQKIVSYLMDKKYNVQYLTGKNATEEQFKKIQSVQPYFIHLATHGFYMPTTKNKKGLIPGTISKFENPLLRSGLILAGGNKAWLGEPILNGKEDGILNAFEISNMDLSHTKFVVLSACETGLGDIKGSEGVFGLQRAFKLAGVEYIINSLWQVPDEQTSELMQAIYFNWVKGMPFEEAFFKAQKTLKANYPPYYWAAFQLVK